MKIPAADIAAALASELGDDAIVPAGLIRALFEAPGQVVGNIGDLITADPAALVSDGDVAALGIVGGENGTAIFIDGVDYIVLAVIPDGSGFSTLTLELA